MLSNQPTNKQTNSLLPCATCFWFRFCFLFVTYRIIRQMPDDGVYLVRVNDDQSVSIAYGADMSVCHGNSLHAVSGVWQYKDEFFRPKKAVFGHGINLWDSSSSSSKPRGYDKNHVSKDKVLLINFYLLLGLLFKGLNYIHAIFQKGFENSFRSLLIKAGSSKNKVILR